MKDFLAFSMIMVFIGSLYVVGPEAMAYIVIGAVVIIPIIGVFIILKILWLMLRFLFS